jgi:hypothetical protein
MDVGSVPRRTGISAWNVVVYGPSRNVALTAAPNSPAYVALHVTVKFAAPAVSPVTVNVRAASLLADVHVIGATELVFARAASAAALMPVVLSERAT